MTAFKRLQRHCIAATLVATGMVANADVVTDWNALANDIVVAARVGPAPGQRVLAMAQVATFEAVNAITQRYPPSGRIALEPSPSSRSPL